MKSDWQRKQARMGEHIPGFPGYSALHYRETDRQFRRLLAGEMEKVRDRLALLLAGDVPAQVRDTLGAVLREVAAMKESLAAGAASAMPAAPPADEESLIDLDLALLDRIAALHSPIDRMETAPEAADFTPAIVTFRQGLEEIEALLAHRHAALPGTAGEPE